MSVYSICLENGTIQQIGARKDEDPVIGVEVPNDEFEKRFPGVLHFVETMYHSLTVRIVEGLFDDELTQICSDVVASRK